MPFYSRDVCDRVRASNDIVDVISSYVKLERKGNRYFGLCPFHNEKTGSFCVTGDSQLFHCFGCHESGNVISFLMKYENMEFTEAIEVLAERAGIELKSETASGNSGEYRKKREGLLAANKAAAEYYYRKLRNIEGKNGLRYFNRRGLDTKILNAFGLGYTGGGSGGLHKYLKEKGFSDELLVEAGLIVFDERTGARDRFFNRVMFPIMDPNRHVIAFGARVMGDGEPKYLNSSESIIFNKSQTLYGLFAARRSKRREFILCEGYMDVISSHMAGFDNAVATLGTALTKEHATVIARYNRPVYICYDSDTAGRNAARRGYEILEKAGIPVKIMDLNPFKDPDELIKAKGREEFESRIMGADNAMLAVMQWEFDAVDSADPDAQTEFIHKLSEKISSYLDEAKRENYIKQSARRFTIDEDLLRRQVNGQGEKRYEERRKTNFERRRLRGVDADKARRENEARLLYYLLDKDYFEKVKKIVEREDFCDEDLKEIYDRITQGFAEGSKIEPADIITSVEEDEKRNFISKVFCEIPDEEERVGAHKIKKEVITRIKQASMRRRDGNIGPKDLRALQESMNIQKEIFDEIEKLEF